MQDRFSSKVNDFVKWSETAIDHYNKGYYADALLNMRKSGEAACKLMFYYRFTEKVAIEKTEGKSYKELIQAVIRQDLSERKVINWLEAMQIHGNDAAHDIRVEKEHAEFAINALRLFIDWMFTQYIKIPVPSRLKKSMEAVHQPVKAENANIAIQKELDKIKKEKEDLEKILVSLSGTKSEETENINKLASELGKSITRLKDLEHEKENAREKEQVLESDENKIEKKKTLVTKKRILVIASILSTLIIILFVVNKWGSIISVDKNTNEIVQDPGSVDSFRVLLLPLSVMQDNPNMTLKFEDAVQNRIQQRVKEKNIPISISFDREFAKSTISFDEATDVGIKHKANIVLFGELYEPQSSSDSAQVNMKFAMTRKQNRIFEEIGIQSFLRLSDSASTKIQMGAVCFVDLSYADFLMSKGKYNQALMVLYDTKPISKNQQFTVADFLATCQTNQKNYSASIKEIEKLIALEPGGDYGYASMANVLSKIGDYKKAEQNYLKALSLKPNNINTLINFANMLASKDVNRLLQSKEVLLTATQYDSTNSLVWQYLGDCENMMANFQTAEKYYRKALSINPNQTAVKISLAQILAFNLDQPEEGEKIVSSILMQDSTNASALFVLANIYTGTKLNNPNKAEYLFLKSKKYQTGNNDYSNKYAQGMAILQKFDYAKAVGLFIGAYQIDSSDWHLCNYIATCYLNLKEYDKALYYAIKGWQKDTLDCINNANLGYFYSHSDKKYFDLKKSAYYFEKALKTNPYDTISLENLVFIYGEQGDVQETKKMLLRLIALSPNNFTANQGLGIVFEREAEYKKAAPYYEKAIALQPENDQVNSKYALCLMKISRKNHSSAFKYAKKAVDLNPANAENCFILSQMYIVSRDYLNAKKYYDKAIELKPSIRDTIVEQEIETLRTIH